MGYGLNTFYYLSENYEQYSFYLGMAIGSGAFLLYLFDCYYWASPSGVFLRKFFLGSLAIATCILTLFMAGAYPHGVIAMFLVLTAGWMLVARLIFYQDVPPRDFVSWLSGPLFFVAMLSFASWLTWALWSEDNEWSVIIALADADDSACEPNFEDYPDCVGDDGGVCFTADTETNTLTFADGCEESCTQVYVNCANGFVIWVGPFLVTLVREFIYFGDYMKCCISFFLNAISVQ